MPYIQFPDIPALPGVPPLLRSGVAQALALSGGLGKLRSLGLPTNFLNPVWGVFGADNKPALVFESVVNFGVRNSCKVSDVPIEMGAFSSYNKTGSPYEARMTISQGGSQASREALLAAVESAVHSTDRYSLITPDYTYHNATLEDYDYRRESTNGAGLLKIDLFFKEVREIAVAEYEGGDEEPLTEDEVKTPDAVSPSMLGQIQAKASGAAAAISSQVASVSAQVAAVKSTISAEVAALPFPLKLVASAGAGSVQAAVLGKLRVL